MDFPANFDFRKTNTLGMQLFTSLAERELNGRIELHDRKRFEIRFKQKNSK